MKIYSMTATFGKLSNETLTLTPGLNVIHAPNEWGKSTWSAFIVCMLYGIDTKERTTQTFLADKNRYAPWSGVPMSGRMDICWNGRDITIERSSTPRAPFGDFRAYETESGIAVPELTATNCGQMLLGVEKSVFQRSGFIRLTDLPVTQDEALRRRLNALVTTGDESGTADDLREKLNTLRNKCKHNKTGLLPQAETQRSEIVTKLERLHSLQQLSAGIEVQQADITKEIQGLKVHQVTLAYQASLADVEKVNAAQAACQQAQEAYEAQEAYCQTIPSQEDCEASILYLEQLRMDMEDLQAQSLPTLPELPEAPAHFTGMSPQQAQFRAEADFQAYSDAAKPVAPTPIIGGILSAAAAAGIAFWDWKFSLPLILLAAFLIGLFVKNSAQKKQAAEKIKARYLGLSPDQWVASAKNYDDAMEQYTQAEAAYRAAAEDLRSRKEDLQTDIDGMTGGQTIAQCIEQHRQISANHQKLLQAYEKWKQAKHHAQTISDMVKVSAPPDTPDPLTYNAADTERLLAAAEAKSRQLQLQLGQCNGQIEALGQASVLQSQLAAIELRIGKLQETYDALTLAMETLTVAANELQRKFAPRISQRAQALFSKLTGGRYHRLQLNQELGVEVAAENETVPQEARRRSDGTVDQLYLALRLAVAEELTPTAPLVLDDALVRFDDTRLAAAVEILREYAQSKQVILFSCQGREQA